MGFFFENYRTSPDKFVLFFKHHRVYGRLLTWNRNLHGDQERQFPVSPSLPPSPLLSLPPSFSTLRYVRPFQIESWALKPVRAYSSSLTVQLPFPPPEVIDVQIRIPFPFPFFKKDGGGDLVKGPPPPPRRREMVRSARTVDL